MIWLLSEGYAPFLFLSTNFYSIPVNSQFDTLAPLHARWGCESGSLGHSGGMGKGQFDETQFAAHESQLWAFSLTMYG